MLNLTYFKNITIVNWCHSFFLAFSSSFDQYSASSPDAAFCLSAAQSAPFKLKVTLIYFSFWKSNFNFFRVLCSDAKVLSLINTEYRGSNFLHSLFWPYNKVCLFRPLKFRLFFSGFIVLFKIRFTIVALVILFCLVCSFLVGWRFMALPEFLAKSYLKAME